MDGDSTTTSDFAIALLGGLTGSVLTFLGTWTLTARRERRERRARLRSMEYEVRSNKVTVEGVLEGREMPFPLRRATWDKVHIDLAADVPEVALERLQIVYGLFDETDERCRRVVAGQAVNSDKSNLEFWRDLCEECQMYLIGELNLIWKVQARLSIWFDRLKNRII